MEERESEGGFKIQDKRRFDDQGNLRASEEQVSTSNDIKSSSQVTSEKTTPDAMKSPQQPQAIAADSEYSNESGIDFTSFVMSLATQAMVQLGEMESPAGIQIPVNKGAARQTIDILSMLHDKTKGNLSQEEAGLMDEILHSLRLSYVKRSS